MPAVGYRARRRKRPARLHAAAHRSRRAALRAHRLPLLHRQGRSPSFCSRYLQTQIASLCRGILVPLSRKRRSSAFPHKHTMTAFAQLCSALRQGQARPHPGCIGRSVRRLCEWCRPKRTRSWCHRQAALLGVHPGVVADWAAAAAALAAAAFLPSTRVICMPPLACQSRKVSSLLDKARIWCTYFPRPCSMRWPRTCSKVSMGSVATAAETVGSVMSRWSACKGP